MKTERFNHILTFGILLLSGLLLYSMLPAKRDIWIFVNSDTLYLPSLYMDIFVHGTGIDGWHLNAAPNFFPDMLLYFPLMAILKKAALTSMVFGLLQMTTVLILINLLIKTVDPGVKPAALYLVNLSFLILPLSSALGEGSLIPSQLLLPAYHCGFFINVLLASLLSFRYLRTGNRALLVLAAVITLLAVVSDRLFVVGYVAPVAGLVILHLIRDRNQPRHLMLLGSVAVATLLGFVLFDRISHLKSITIISTGWKMFQFDKMGESFLNLANHMKAVIVLNPLQRWVIVPGLLYMILSPIYLLVRLGSFLQKRMNPGDNASYQLILYLSLFFYAVFFTPVINGSYVGEAIIRYNYAALVIGAAGFVYMGWHLPGKRLKPFRYGGPLLSLFSAGVLSLLLVAGIRHSAMEGLRGFVGYYPETSRILDGLKDEHALKYGVSNYWKAKQTTLFSRNDVRLYTVFDGTFRPWYHVTNEHWYHDGGKGKYAHPVFNYMVVDEFRDTGKLEALFGRARDTIYNEGGITVVKVPEFKFDMETREIYLTGS